MSQALSQYFAPSYFSPFYFPPLVVPGDEGGDNGAAVSPYRDRDAYEAIVAALVGTGEFAGVVFGTSPDRIAAGVDLSPVAVVTPDSWVEFDDVDPTVLLRQVYFSLTLAVRDEDPFTRYEKLDFLSCISLNALDGLNLGGACLPALTRLGKGRFEMDSRHPEQRIILSGEFAYLIPSLNGHNTTY